uniref:FAD-binding PCMH-type domain-containing protein n=1 Tax=Arcella intermedia TaxID=1963864 RepID=A0A6B2L169_9EUKA
MTVRNNPLEGWSPAFVAWPTTPAQVQLLVKFATLHNLCISVTNTGHDYLNRHSCDHSLDIRTSLLKDVAWDASPFSVRVGAGVTSSELQSEASLVGKLVVTPWSKSVGMVGWSLGGGRSLLAPRYGLGADQIVGVQLVGPDGCLYDVDVTGTEKRHLDGRVEQFEDCELLWAVRGGGGSTWGVITALTLKTHPVPQGGATATGLLFTAYGDCTNDFSSLLELYFSWSLTLDSKWAGTASVVPYPSDDGCNMWGFVITYFYQGGDNYLDTWKAFTRNVPEGISPYESIEEHITLWDIFLRADLEKILPEPFLAPVDHFSGAWPSVLLSRETVKSGALVEIMKTQLGKCTADQCDSWEFSQDLTGNINSPQDSDVSISPGMRTSILHLRIPRTQELSLYDALGKHSYFSESAYMMEDWPERYWGNRNYRRLSHIKKAFDENNVFWCRHCVGDLQNTSHSHF